MLAAAELKNVFEKAYDRNSWYRILQENFNVNTLKQTPQNIPIGKNDYDAQAFELGNFTTNDEGHLVGIYEVEVPVKAKLHLNRKGLRELLKKVYSNDVEAALLVFIQGNKWRFSYVSEITVKNKTTGKREKKTTDPKRFTYLLGEGERAKTAADRFAGIKKKDDLFGGGVTLAALEDAFNVEKMSKAFFNEYRKQYGYFTAQLTGEDENGKKVKNASPFLKSTFNGDHKQARDFVKKMLGRIVFLYFLEKKGWLGIHENGKWGDGDENFLSNLYKHCKGKREFYANVLVPLFFATLNTERKDDYFKIEPSLFTQTGYNKLKIPYLNGGLFEEDETLTQFLVFPEELFAGLFNFFDQYNFTVYEDSPDEHTVAVDPEMLGHIFENLLEDNKDKGAFYTPKEIVHYMCRESLIEYLYTKLNPAQTESFKELGNKQTDLFGNKAKKQLALEETISKPKEIVSRESIEKLVLHHEAAGIIEHDETILKALYEVKICDPAIGSGAFPMGLLMEIFHLIETLYEASPDVTAKVWKLGTKWNPAKVKEEIIQNSIYGVDIEKGAVDIARLRFWLSLVVDETTPKPLPNLDYKIVVGNSLLSKFGDEVIEIDWNIKAKNASAVERIINDQQMKLNLLHTRQHEYFQAGVDKQKQQQRIRDLKIDILVNQLTLERIAYADNNQLQHTAFPSEKEKKKEEIVAERIRDYNRTMHKLEILKNNKDQQLNFFDWKLDFPELMNEKVAKSEVGFDIVIGNPPYIVLSSFENEDFYNLQKMYKTTFGRINTFAVFTELTTKIVKGNGSCSLIIPDSLCLIDYYSNLRKYLLDNTTIQEIIELGDGVFESAVVPTIIFSYKKIIANRNKIKIGFGQNLLQKKDFKQIEQEYYLKAQKYSFNLHFDSVYLKLQSLVDKKIAQRLSETATIKIGVCTGNNKKYISETPEFKNSKKVLQGRDINRYALHYSNLYLDYDKKKLLRARDESIFLKTEKLLMRQTSDKLILTYDDTQFYTIDSLFLIFSDDPTLNLKYLLALLNSSLLNRQYQKLNPEKGRVFAQVKIDFVNELPIVIASTELQKKIIKVVDKILFKKKTTPQADTIKTENEINYVVYKLYSLTYEEACIVEGNNTWMSKEAYEKFTIE